MRARHLTLLLVTALWTATVTPGAAKREAPHKDASQPKLDRFLQRMVVTNPAHERVRVIITAREDARDQVKSSLKGPDTGVLDDYPLINAVTADVPVGRLRALAARSDILGVSV